jgi:hypothetical protein
MSLFLGKAGDTTVGVTGLLRNSSSNLWSGGIGSSLRAAVTGSLNDAPNELLGSVQFTLLNSNAAAPYGITADFNSIHPTSQSAVVRSNGVVVIAVTGQTAPVVRSSHPPLSVGTSLGRTNVITGKFAVGTRFELNGQTFAGDELLLLAAAPSRRVDYHSEIALTASGLSEFTVGSVQSEPLVLCPPNMALSITLAGANTVLAWGGNGYRLEGATVLASPSSATVWTSIAGGSPVTLSASGPQRFFRLVCP